MKVAVIGCGKTGQAVVDLLKADEITDVFDVNNVATVEKLNKADVAIVFVSADVLKNILPTLLQSEVAVVCGTTGFNYTEDFIQKIKEHGQTWVVANNFSLSMVLIKEMFNTLGNLQHLITNMRFQLRETHHIQKLDAPSGTALSWQSWLNVKDCPIDSVRKEDVKGEHMLQAYNEYESIEFKHVAHDRRLFAEGAVWSARYLCKNVVDEGLCQFDELVRSESW